MYNWEMGAGPSHWLAGDDGTRQAIALTLLSLTVLVVIVGFVLFVVVPGASATGACGGG